MTEITVYEIGGQDFGPAGLNMVLQDPPPQFESGGIGQVGRAQLSLESSGAGSYTIRNSQLCRIYRKDVGTGYITLRRFLGYLIMPESGQNPGTQEKTWTLEFVDMNVDLLALRSSANYNEAVRLSAGTFSAQIAQAVYQLQHGIDNSLTPALEIDATTYVANLGSSTVLPATAPFQDKSLLEILKSIFASLRAVSGYGAVRPVANLMFDPVIPSGGAPLFGGPVLQVFDGALLPSPSIRLSHLPDSTHAPVLPEALYRRRREGPRLVTRRQGVRIDPPRVFTTADSTAIGLYPHATDGHGAWMDSALTWSDSPSDTEAQARLDGNVAARAYPRDIHTLTTDQACYAGQIAALTTALEGLSEEPYIITSVTDVLVVPDLIERYAVTLGSRQLLLGDSPDDDVFAAPVEEDRIPPEPPSAFVIISNVYNWQTQRADVTLGWVESPSEDRAGQEITIWGDQGMQRFRTAVGVTTLLVSLVPGTLVPAFIRAYDGTFAAPHLFSTTVDLVGGITPAGPTLPAAPTWPSGSSWLLENLYLPKLDRTRVRVQWNDVPSGNPDAVTQWTLFARATPSGSGNELVRIFGPFPVGGDRICSFYTELPGSDLYCTVCAENPAGLGAASVEKHVTVSNGVNEIGFHSGAGVALSGFTINPSTGVITASNPVSTTDSTLYGVTTDGIAVRGDATGTGTTSRGVLGYAAHGAGVVGESGTGAGVLGTAGGPGVAGHFESDGSAGAGTVLEAYTQNAHTGDLFRAGNLDTAQDFIVIHNNGTLVIGPSGTALVQHLSGTGTVSPGAIAAGTTADSTFTLTGAAVGDSITVSPNGAPEAGLVWSGYVSAANTVAVRLANVTGGSITPASRSYRVDCWQH